LAQLAAVFLAWGTAAAAEPAAPSATLDALYTKCDALAQAGQFAEARAVAEQILARADVYAVRLRLGWLNFKCGDLAAAEANYRRAAQMIDGSADPWLGLQLVALQRQDWRAAQAAGEKALAADPDNYWATARDAFAVYMQGSYAAAETLYRRALQLRPDEPEMLLGLGFTRIRRGAVAEGRGLCEQARAKLGADPRVDECLAMAPAPKTTGAVTASATYLQYTHPWDLRDVENITATGAVTFPVGVSPWAGVSYSRSVLNYTVDNFWQWEPVVGVEYHPGRWWLGGSGAWLISNEADVNTTKTVALRAGYDGAPAGAAGAVAASFYPSFAVFQADAEAVFRIARRAVIGVGPEIIAVGAHQQDGPVPGPVREETLASGHVYVRWQVVGPLTLSASGFYGRRRHAVDDSGVSIWSSDDLFAGGYDAGLAVSAGRYLQITLDFQQSFGIQQEYLQHNFSLLGGTLGLQANF
jgi:tetratricopeptide (TPR) repeat protein